MNRRHALLMVSLLPMAAFAGNPAWAFGEGDVTAAESAILSAGERAAIVARLKHVPSVGVVDLRFRAHPRKKFELPDPAAFRISVAKNQAGVNRLRRALIANPVTRAAMERHHIDVNRVAGVMISSGGSLRFFMI